MNGLTIFEFHNSINPVKGEPDLDEGGMLLYQSNALCGEAGEVANNVKKIVRDGRDLDGEVVIECGDVLFYMSRLLKMRGFTLEDAAQALLDKLEAQRREGTWSGDRPS